MLKPLSCAAPVHVAPCADVSGSWLCWHVLYPWSAPLQSIHLQVTVAVVKYRSLSRERIGVTSTLLAERLQVGQQRNRSQGLAPSPQALHDTDSWAAVHCGLLMQRNGTFVSAEVHHTISSCAADPFQWAPCLCTTAL